MRARRRSWSPAASAVARRSPRRSPRSTVGEPARLARRAAALAAPAAAGARRRRAPRHREATSSTRAGGAGASRCSSTSIPSFDVDGLPADGVVAANSNLTCATRCCVPTRRGPARFAPAELRVRTLGGSLEMRNRRRRRGDAARLSRTSPRSRAMPGWPATGAWPRSASRAIRCAAAAPTSSSSPTTAPATRSATSTGRRRCATAARSCASTRTSATSASSSCSTAAAACAPTRASPGRRGSHFDAALDALMLLAYVALKEGDEVGAMTFGGARDVEPQRSRRGRACSRSTR